MTAPSDRTTPPSPDAAAGRAATGSDGAHRPPETPERHGWLALGIKMALAMYLAAVAARLCGFEDPTLAVIGAAFLATGAPIGSLRSAGRRFVALGVGLVLGTAGALAGQALAGVPTLHVALIGLVAGALGARSSDYLFVVVVGALLSFAGAAGGDPLPEIVAATACTVAIGCLIGPAVVWAVERSRALASRAVPR